jgi:hypothetical protein
VGELEALARLLAGERDPVDRALAEHREAGRVAEERGARHAPAAAAALASTARGT